MIINSSKIPMVTKYRIINLLKDINNINKNLYFFNTKGWPNDFLHIIYKDLNEKDIESILKIIKDVKFSIEIKFVKCPEEMSFILTDEYSINYYLNNDTEWLVLISVFRNHIVQKDTKESNKAYYYTYTENYTNKVCLMQLAEMQDFFNEFNMNIVDIDNILKSRDPVHVFTKMTEEPILITFIKTSELDSLKINNYNY